MTVATESLKIFVRRERILLTL